jgi:hypothetical protein
MIVSTALTDGWVPILPAEESLERCEDARRLSGRVEA